jgi:hypothetical protein
VTEFIGGEDSMGDCEAVWLEAVRRGDVAGSCMAGVQLLVKKGQASFRQSVVAAACANPAKLMDKSFVSYLCSRLEMLDRVYRSDMRPLHRLVVEVSCTLAKCCGQEESGRLSSVKGSMDAGGEPFRRILDQYASKHVAMLMRELAQGGHANMVQGLLLERSYAFEVKVPGVHGAQCKDSLWVPWLLLDECAVCDVGTKAHIDHLYSIFRSCFRKVARARYAVLLDAALRALFQGGLVRGDLMLGLVTLEAMWKSPYLLEEMGGGGKKKNK